MVEPNKPDVNRTLEGLKDFQRNTVEYVYRRLYEDSDAVDRFLVADETGLGKTYVARGIIAKVIDRLWDSGKERINVVYICSNAVIARQNVRRLIDPGSAVRVEADRLTLLATRLGELHTPGAFRVNVIAFTPGTSFNVGNRSGRVEERAAIYHLLRDAWGFGNRKGPLNLLQGDVRDDTWLYQIEKQSGACLDDLSERYFLRCCEKHRERFMMLARRASRARTPESMSPDLKEAQRELIGQIRAELATVCVNRMQADLVIMDEFHRFRDLLNCETEAGALAWALFESQESGHADNDFPTKVLLLSATPYKMYTTSGELYDDHYHDFIDTVDFLMNDEGSLCDFKSELDQLRLEIQRAAMGVGTGLPAAKDAVEERLRRVMVRTERLAATADRSGMLQEIDEECLLEARDFEEFRAIDTVSRHLGAPDAVEYWKSAPYILNCMDTSYQVKRRLKECVANDQDATEEVARALQDLAQTGLCWDQIRHYKPVDIANSRMRTLSNDTVDLDMWKLLWLPPSIPYYSPSDGPYRDVFHRQIGKALVFSKWQVVPKTIAMMLSYEAERRAVRAAGGRPWLYDSVRRGTGLLRFSRSADGDPEGMASMLLFYPCWTLASHVDPAMVAARHMRDSEGSVIDQEKLLAEVEGAVRTLIRQVPFAQHAKPDGDSTLRGYTEERWLWTSLAALDAHFNPYPVCSWFNPDSSSDAESWRTMVPPRHEGLDDTAFATHVDEFTAEFWSQVGEKGSAVGKTLAEAMGEETMETVCARLAKAAVGSPAVVALRAMLRLRGDEPLSPDEGALLMAYSAQVALAFRDMFNQPESSVLVQPRRQRSTRPYWANVLDYCIGGNLQAAMDEYMHILRESIGSFDPQDAVTFEEMCTEIADALTLRTVSLDFDEIVDDPNGSALGVRLEQHRIRCRFALRLGDGNTEGSSTVVRSSQVMGAFNSPFRPFVLATTSTGQEGIDLHQYCRDVYHWNLPSNPVDMEQREGRVHRYKCYAVRRGVAADYGKRALAKQASLTGCSVDVWSTVFRMALDNRDSDSNDLEPFWVVNSANAVKINRHVLVPILSWESQALPHLRRSLVLYRMVFGQARQEDLLEFIQRRTDRSEIPDELADLRIDLSPR